MAYEYKKHAMVDGKKFGPSPGDRYYQPAGYHNPVNGIQKKGRKAKKAEHEDKTHWNINRSQQYDVFLEGESNDFIDQSGIFSLLDDCNEILGQDVLSVTKDNEITLHAIDTLDLERDLNHGIKRNQVAEPVDLFAGMDAIPYNFIGKIEGEVEGNDVDLPW